MYYDFKVKWLDKKDNYQGGYVGITYPGDDMIETLGDANIHRMLSEKIKKNHPKEFHMLIEYKLMGIKEEEES